jgi:type IV pilus assembly protein PilE
VLSSAVRVFRARGQRAEDGVAATRDYRITAGKKPAGRRGGFTLVELMVSLTVVAIIAAVAYPAYQEHMRKGRRAAAQAFLVDTASRQQQYLLDARSYAVGTGAIAALSLTVPTDVAPFYTVEITPAAATVPPTYRILATPVATSAQAPDGALTLDQDGGRTRGGNPGW